MSDARGGGARRDGNGRIGALPDLLGRTLAGLTVGILALVLLDWAFELIGLGDFGRANGWLALVLPAWLFVEEFRSSVPGPARVLAALVSAAVSLALGLLAAGLAKELPPLASGAIASAVTALSYAVIWFYGVRWLDHRVS
ncbi:MAG TPA: hypothetical protein VF462_09010 [Micromonosporaceae bacterium]